jgi:hypothetical protein
MFIRETARVKPVRPVWSAAMRTEEVTARPGTVSAKTALTSAFVLAAALAGLTAALGYVDGTGLFAPENWVDAGTFPSFATSPAWATVTFLPVLVVGSAAGYFLTVRAARPGTRARWALGAAWSSMVLTAFLAKLAYSVLLLAVAGPAGLHPVPVVAAVLAECGLCGAKYAFFGVLVAAPAALAYLISARRAARRATASGATCDNPVFERAGAGGRSAAGMTASPAWSPVWLLAGALLAAAAAGRGYPWLEGSGRALILPACGLAGSWLATWALWPGTMAALAARRGPAACWASAALTVAGCAAGYLLPFVASGLVSGFGGGLYPVAGALAHVAAGVIAGACASALGLAWAALRSRRPLRSLADKSRATPAVRYGATAAAVVLLLGIDLVPSAVAAAPASYPVPSVPSAGGGGLLPLTVLRAPGKAPVIGDSAGRQVLLRGVNVSQLIDYGQPDKSKPTVRPLSEADYAQMAAQYGFDVQRLNLSWSQLEPERGQFSQAYIARVRQAVDWAAAHGIYTVLDMHQDTYSKYVTAAPGTSCRLGATPEFGNDGAPAWATLSDGAKGCGFQGRDLSPNVEQSFTNLYDNTDGIATQYADAWGVLARAFAGDTAVAGYDLLNEPGPGNSPGVTSSLLLGRLYQQAITQIRAAEAAAPGGFHHLVFFEPSILWSGLGFDVSPPAGFSSDPDLVFSPHLYSQSITMDQGVGVTLVTIEQGFTLAMRTAAAYGAPLWSGEWGWFGTSAGLASDFDRFLDQQNSDILGSAIWEWKQACGDPQADLTAAQSGGLDIYSCVTGKELPSPAFRTTALAQAYPRSAPGRLSRLVSSPTTVNLSLAGNGTGLLDVWIPRGRSADSWTGLRGVNITATPGGGFRLTGTAAGAYTLSVR